MNTRSSQDIRNEHGFTMVEVLVAMLLLLVGVLGTVELVNRANASTVTSRNRQAGLNLAREVAEAGRRVDYGNLTCASPCALSDAFPTQAQTLPGLNSTSGTTWTVQRSGVDYKVNPVTICKVDEGRDGFGVHDSSYCGGASACTVNCTDDNTDDYRRIAVTASWTAGTAGNPTKQSVRQVALISNPSGGVGPGVNIRCIVTSAIDTACPNPNKTTIVSGTTQAGCNGTTGRPTAAQCTTTTPDCTVGPVTAPCVPIHVVTDGAARVHWSVDDGKSAGEATETPSGSTTSWNFGWQIGNVTFPLLPAVLCGASDRPSGGILDGNYVVSMQAFRQPTTGAGGLRTLTITLNRYAPAIPCPPKGGYNKGPLTTSSPVTDFTWEPNIERDIKGYVVYWAGANGIVGTLLNPNVGAGDDVVVGGTCGTVAAPVSTTSCFDAAPGSHGLTAGLPAAASTYYLTAIDNWGAQSGATLLLPVVEGATSRPATPVGPGGGNVTAAFTNNQPQLTWSINPADYGPAGPPPPALDPDVGDSILFYRIYRNGTGYANRYATVKFPDPTPSNPNPTTASFTDAQSGLVSGANTYRITAVDNHYQESNFSGPWTP